MVGRTPNEAWIHYQAPLRSALGCIAPGRFILREPQTGLRLHSDYSVTLNDMNSVPLKSANRIFLIAGQTVRIAVQPDARRRERYRFETHSYAYGFTIRHDLEERELLTFHLDHPGNPLDHPGNPNGIIPRAHLHIGPALLATQTAIRPRDFHRAHVPTGHVTFASVVRFAIAELGVSPLVENWQSVLRDSDEDLQRTLSG